MLAAQLPQLPQGICTPAMKTTVLKAATEVMTSVSVSGGLAAAMCTSSWRFHLDHDLSDLQVTSPELVSLSIGEKQYPH